jgi:hypothetical protein
MMDVSRVTTKQPTFVTLSPCGWNLLEAHGYPHKKPLAVTDPLTEGEKALYDIVSEQLKTEFGPEQREYRLDIPIDDPNHYCVDNWKNLDHNWRDQVPGQAEMRRKAFAEYAQPKPRVGIREKLLTDPLFRKAVGMVLDVLPPFTATPTVIEASIPFMKKHTSVGYIGDKGSGLNDRTIVPGTDFTAGELARKIAEEINQSPKSLWLPKLSQFAVWVALGRNKRAKGRGIEAGSRVLSIFFNQIEHNQIEACKRKSPAFVGYKDPSGLKQGMVENAEFCKKWNLWSTNWDQSSYDKHVPPDLISLVGALWMERANGDRAKHMAYLRAVFALRGWLVNGMEGSIVEILGRIFSGYIDTNLLGSVINLIVSLYVNMVQDPNYSRIWYEAPHPIVVMGDDSGQIHQETSTYHHNEVELMQKHFGFEINPNKGEEGIFFLQRRLFKPTSYDRYVMVTPVTRAIRSFFFKENTAPLGKFGWVIANLQLIDMLRDYPPALDVFVRTCMPYDKMRLGVDCSPSILSKGVALEDRLAMATKGGRRKRSPSRSKRRDNNQSAAGARRRVKYSADVIFDGDPTKNTMFEEINGVPVLKQGFISELLQSIRESVLRIGHISMKVEPYQPEEVLAQLMRDCESIESPDTTSPTPNGDDNWNLMLEDQ